MANKKVIPNSLTDAYKKREGDFSPDLVGLQLTKGTPLFTLGNFGITTNLNPKVDTVFNNGNFSGTYTLDNLELTEQESELLVSNSIYTTLNLDPTDLSKFVYYGSFVEYLRVNIEGIITKWKGSLYITDDLGGFSRNVKNTVLGYSYSSLEDTSYLTIPTLFVENKFGLITNDLGGLILDAREISNIKLSYKNYEIKNEFGSFEILGYTGDTEGVNPYIKVTLKGEAFPTLTATTFGTFKYHLKPKDSVVDRLFFDSLTDFENILLNRLVAPKYTSVFESIVETESGSLLSVRKSFTWPTTDGFNIDVDTVEYTQYIEGLLRIGEDQDRFKSNLMTRRFVSNSIHEFDTEGDGTGDESQGRKVNKLLKIYGREFDEVKKYVDSIKYANVVTYDKKDNTPDELIKNMARTLGFDAIKSVSDNKLINYIAKSNEIIFSGQSRSMSTKEIDTELWRRLVINAWWLFKSKGHRKVLEFLTKLFGLNECLVNIDECVYVVKDKLDVEETFNKIQEVLSTINIVEDPVTPAQSAIVNRDDYPIDEEGFPRTLPNTPEYYFQMDGFWYNNGTNKTIGNNPHYGPYDYGNKYFDKFRCFIDDYSGVTTEVRQEFIENVNLFTDYNNGDLEITFEDGKPLPDYSTYYADLMENKGRVSSGTDVILAGFSTQKSRTGRGSLKITFSTCSDKPCDLTCPVYQIEDNGLVVEVDSSGNVVGQLSDICCREYGFSYTGTRISDINKVGLNRESLLTIQNYEKSLVNYGGDTFFSQNPNACFWCKPTVPVCDFEKALLALLNQQGVNGIVNLLINEGILTQEQVGGFLIQWNQDPDKSLMDIVRYFNGTYEGFCVLFHEDATKPTRKCCETRGGQWVSVYDTEFCGIPKDITPPDPCACDLPEFCEYKDVTQYYMHGFSYLDCTDYYIEFENLPNLDFDLLGDFRAQRDAFIRFQNEYIIGGGSILTRYPVPVDKQPQYSSLTNYSNGYISFPKPVVGQESYTGYDTWRVVNTSTCCPNDFFGWVPDVNNQTGEPIISDTGVVSGGKFLTPCPAQESPRALESFGPIDELPDGTEWVTDYEDIATFCRATRDAALKAKNELSLATYPFFSANETAPNYFLQKCGYNCTGDDCGCTDDTVDVACPPHIIVDYTLDEFRFTMTSSIIGSGPTYTKSLYE